MTKLIYGVMAEFDNPSALVGAARAAPTSAEGLSNSAITP
jgi:hypothetical protein